MGEGSRPSLFRSGSTGKIARRPMQTNHIHDRPSVKRDEPCHTTDVFDFEPKPLRPLAVALSCGCASAPAARAGQRGGDWEEGL